MMEPTEEKDKMLWQTAKKRAGFKAHFYIYIIVNLFLWGIWLFTGAQGYNNGFITVPWPAWTTLAWGLGVALITLVLMVPTLQMRCNVSMTN